MKVGSLFAGIGGFDLAARNVGWSTSWYSEIDPYACRVMQKHFPDAVNLGDITQITNPPAVDVLCGGFPCQDISYAGKGAGIAVGTRSGLWCEYARLIAEVRPRWVVAENVAALRTNGLGRVLRDLDALGYMGQWHCIPAAAVDAPHQRDRIWIVAHADGIGAQISTAGIVAAVEESRVYRTPGSFISGHRGWATLPDMVRSVHGLPARVDRIACLGNAIVPQIAEILFRAINDAEAGRTEVAA